MSQKEGNQDSRARLEHLGLRRLLAELSRTLKAPGERRAIPRQFTQLHRTLEDHFGFEEKGGYFEGVLSDAPWLAHEVGALRDQHAAFLQETLKLQGLVVPKPTKANWEDVEVAFRRFRRRLLQHENRENRLALRAAARDVIASD